MTVRVGVIGVGVMGAEHVRLLTEEVPNSSVSAVFDVVADRAAAVAASVGTTAHTDPAALIDDAGVDAVLVASSDATHEPLVRAALAAGKPVLCEKPMAPDVAGCRRIVEAEIAAGRRLVTVGFMRRFDPGYLDLKAALQDGAIGAALMLHCVHRNTTASGVDAAATITGSVVHEMDIVRWLLDDEIAAVEVRVPRGTSALDFADPLFVLLHTAGGVLVDVEAFVNAQYGYEVRAELVGETGTILLDAPVPTVHRRARTAGRTLPVDWRPRFAAAYRAELTDWIAAVTAGRTSHGASAWDGYVATATAQAGVTALADGGVVPVRLDPRPELYA